MNILKIYGFTLHKFRWHFLIISYGLWILVNIPELSILNIIILSMYENLRGLFYELQGPIIPAC